MVTRNQLTSALAALETRLENRVELWRVIVNADGTVVRRVYRCSFQAPPDWQPPEFEDLVARAKGQKGDHAPTFTELRHITKEKDHD